MFHWSKKNTKDPQMTNRFTVSFFRLGGGGNVYEIPQQAVKSCQRPTFTTNIKEYSNLFHNYKYPTKIVWNDIDIVFVEIKDPPISKVIADIYKIMGASYSDSSVGMINNLSKASATSNLNIIIDALDEDGNISEQWELFNPIIVSPKSDDLAYEGGKISELSIKISYDYAKIKNY